MKKAKIFLASLLLVVASAFISACSCSADPGITHIYATDFNVECITPIGDHVNNIDQPAGSEIPVIECFSGTGKKIDIRYIIDPSDATTTNVSWAFDKTGYVVPLGGEWGRSKTTNEVVSFIAQAPTDSKGVELTFTLTQLNKTAKCRFIVNNPANVSTFDKPMNITFDSNKNEIRWDKVAFVINKNQDRVPVNSDNLNNLRGYEVSITDNESNTTVVTTVDANTNTYSKHVDSATGEEYSIKPGVSYEFKVRAIGNPLYVRSSEYSEPLKLFKLESTKDVTNNNGQISFTTPEYSSEHEIYYGQNHVGYTPYKIASFGGSEKLTVDHKQFANGNAFTSYNIKVVSFPTGYDSNKGYAEIDGINYYPSDLSADYYIHKLQPAEIKLVNSENTFAVEGVPFEYVQDSTKIKLSLPATLPVGTQIKYSIYKYNNELVKADVLNVTKLQDEACAYVTLNTLTAGGDYFIKTQTIGGSNTISSDKVSSETPTLSFKIINQLQRTSSLSNVTIGQNSYHNRITFDTGFVNSGIEVFFIYQDDDNLKTEYSKHFVLTGANELSEREYDFAQEFQYQTESLAPGRYAVYAQGLIHRTVENIEDEVITTYTNASIRPENLSKLFDITIRDVVTGYNGDGSGNVSFMHEDFGNGDNPSFLLKIQRRPLSNVSEIRDTHYATINFGQEIDEASYVLSGNTATFNIMKVLEGVLPQAFLNDLNSFFDGYEVQLSSVALGHVEGDPIIINSKESSVIKFQRLVFGQDCQIVLNNYIVAFDQIPNASRYKVWLETRDENEDIIDTYYSKVLTQGDGYRLVQGKIQVNLNEITASVTVGEGQEEKAFATLVDPEAKYHIIYVQAIGGSSSESIYLDSGEIYTPLSITHQPTDVTVDETGILSWSTATPFDSLSNYSYTIRFFGADGAEIPALRLEGVTPALISVAEEETEGEGEGEESQEPTTPPAVQKLSTNIVSILSQNLGQTFGITIEEMNAGMLTGRVSDKIYATKMSTPVLNYAIDEGTGKKLVSWEAVDHATVYDITILNGTPWPNKIQNYGETHYSITDQVATWGVGEYTFTVVARNNQINGTSETDPFVVTSNVSSSITVRIVSQNIDVNVDGETLSWDNICGDTGAVANYQVRYTLALLDGEDTTQTQTFDNGSSTTYNAKHFHAGTNMVTIVPTIDYTTTGFVLINELKDNPIVKWGKATNLKANGNLAFDVANATDASEITIELYQAGSTSPVSTDFYTLTSESIGGGVVRYSLSLDGLDAGELTLQIKVKSLGKLDSDLSDEYVATKIAAVSDFTKDGNKLVWTSQPGISQYDISFKPRTSEVWDVLSLKVEEQADGSYKAFVKNPEDETQDITDDSKFKYEEGKFYYLFDESLFVNGITGDIDFAIRPLTVVDHYYSGNTKTGLVVTKLHNNTPITISGGVVNIAPFEADGSAIPMYYTISIYKLEMQQTTDAEGNPVDELLPNLSKGYAPVDPIAYTGSIAPIDLETVGLNEEGAYVITIRYIGDRETLAGEDSLILSSESYEDATLLNKLETTSLTTKSGLITWSNIEGATGYTVEVNDGSNTQLFNVTSMSGAETSIANNTFEIPSTDSGDGTTTAAAGTFSFEPGKVYTLRVRATAEDKLHSKWSETFQVKKLFAPSNVKITSNTASFEMEDENGDPVEIIPVGYPVISWQKNNTTNARLDYEMIYGTSKTTLIPAPESDLTTGITYPLDTNLAVGSYGMQLKIFGSTTENNSSIGLLTSDYSAPVTATYVAEVAGPVVNAGVISWQKVNGAYSYKVCAYETDAYNAYKADVTGTVLAPTAIVSLYTTNTTIDFASLKLADLSVFAGNYTFEINAITEPALSIVSTLDAVLTNFTSVYKPNLLEEYKVKNGMLNWKISIADIVEFVNAQNNEDGTNKLSINTASNQYALEVVKYVIKRVNGNVEPNAELDAQIAHLLNFRFNINGKIINDQPTLANVVKKVEAQDENGVIKDEHGNTVYNEVVITTESAYLTEGQYIEYYYNVGINPEVETATVAEGSSSEIPVYTEGRYVIKISPIGNASETTPVVNSGYTMELVAYKPNTPKTWTTQGADIYLGKLQWELSTTEKTTLERFDYYKYYRVTAMPIDSGNGVVSVDVNVDDHAENINDRYRFYRNIKDDLFYTEEAPGETRAVIGKSSHYRLLINTIGTADSTRLAAGETIYLNSNSCVVNELANILSPTMNFRVQNSNMGWSESRGSTATRLFIYGPFDNLNSNETKIDNNWSYNLVSDAVLDKIDQLYRGDKTGLTEEEIAKYSNMLTVVTKSGLTTTRQNHYTLTDELYNNQAYLPGGYVIKLQELGNDRGVIDSAITSERYVVNKLGSVTSQTSGWVGTNNSEIFEWIRNTDTWDKKDYYSGDVNEKIGVFVWKSVPGANAYKINMYQQNVADPNAAIESIGDTFYTRQTRFEMPNEVQDHIINDSNYRYLIRVVAIRTKVLENPEKETFDLEDNYFSSDFTDSTSHLRLAIPTELTLHGNGMLTWNGKIEDTIIGAFRVRFNSGETTDTEMTQIEDTTSSFPEIDLSVNSQAGRINIDVSSLSGPAVDERGLLYLNSCYCESGSVIRISDPDVRLLNGVFNWGSGVDPYTPTVFIKDGVTETIGDYESPYDTFIYYYTNVTTHDLTGNSPYSAIVDEMTYQKGEHTFQTMFKGTIEEATGEVKLVTGQDYYIASNNKSLTATKLAAPNISNVNLNISQGYENMIKWQYVENAEGYRIRIFSTTLTGAEIETYEEGQLPEDENSGELPQQPTVPPTTLTDYIEIMISKVDLDKIFADGVDDEQFVVELVDGKYYAYLKLNEIINGLNLKGQGGQLFVYVQAIGSGFDYDDVNSVQDKSARPDGSTQLFLSSSYSTPTAIGIPPTPTNFEYRDPYGNEGCGIVAWEVDSTTPYNIRLITEYTVDGVTNNELASYWQASADIYNGIENTKTYIPYEEIVYREVTQGTKDSNDAYSITVRDTIRLVAENNNNKTPTSYKLTTIAYNYKFYITALSFPDDMDLDNFASGTLETSSSYSFSRFGRGDGSTKYPYTIGEGYNQTAEVTDQQKYYQLNDIRYFTDRNFKIVSDINASNVTNTVDQNKKDYKNGWWQPIFNEFSGTLDGGNHTLQNFKYVSLEGATSTTGGRYSATTLFAHNTGVIKNLNIKIADGGMVYNSNHTTVKVAPVAIENYGLIDNVHILEGSIINVLSTATNTVGITSVAGIAIENITGTDATKGIINCSVNATIVSKDNDDTGKVAIAGGIVATNNGIIKQSNFQGSIRSNYVGGIAVDNRGQIDRCYVENAIIYATDEASTNANIRKDVVAGGIAAIMSAVEDCNVKDVKLTNSYSQAAIRLSKKASGQQANLGGFVGMTTIDKVSGLSMSISNNYVVADINVEDGKTAEGTIAAYYTTKDKAGIINTNNYFMLPDGYQSTIGGIDSNNTLGTQCNDIEDLRTRVAAIRDNGFAVFENPADESKYPTLIRI